MLGVTFQDIKKINEIGYRIIESESGTRTEIIDEKEHNIATITTDEQGLLTIVVGTKSMKNVKWVNLKGEYCPAIIMMTIKADDDSIWWSAIPFREGLPVFWRS